MTFDAPFPPYRRAALLARVQADPLARDAWEEARAHMRADAAHDAEHLLRVAHGTLALAHGVPEGLALAAALLHDVVNLPKNSPDRARASERSAAHVAAFLRARGVPDGDAALAADAVRTHSFSRGEAPVSALGDGLQDADRLDALGAVGLARWLATNAALGTALAHPDDPWAEARDLDEGAFAVDHALAKLVRLPATMRTARGRAEAGRRAGVLHAFLTALGEEIGVPYPGGGRSDG